MKPFTLFLSLSLVANAALLGAIVLRWQTAPATLSLATTDAGNPAGPTREANGTINSIKVAAPHLSTHSSGTSNLWRQLETDDLEVLGDRLRAAGFPRLAVFQVIFDLAEAKAEIARAAAQGKTAKVPYWKTQPYFPDDPALRKKVQEANDELHKIFRKHFYSAEAIADEEGTAAFARERYGNLPVEKLQQLHKISRDYHDLRNEIHRALRAGPDRELTAAEREKNALLNAEEQRDFQQALTPEEFEQYELRSSPTARTLREMLDTFRPSEAEFKALFALQRSIDTQLKGGNGSEAETRRAATAAMQALAPQVQAALGPERYADYVQAMEPGTNQINRLMARLDLPLATVSKLDAVRSDITQRATALRADPKLAPADRDARLAALAQEARTSLTATLGGDRGLTAYEELKGDWLRALTDRPATP